MQIKTAYCPVASRSYREMTENMSGWLVSGFKLETNRTRSRRTNHRKANFRKLNVNAFCFENFKIFVSL